MHGRERDEIFKKKINAKHKKSSQPKLGPMFFFATIESRRLNPKHNSEIDNKSNNQTNFNGKGHREKRRMCPLLGKAAKVIRGFDLFVDTNQLCT